MPGAPERIISSTIPNYFLCCSTSVSRCFSPSTFPLRKPHEDLVHLLSRNGLESLRPGIPAHAQAQRQKPDCFVVGGIDHKHEIVAPHGPEDLLDRHSHLLRILLESFRTFGCFLHATYPQVRP